MKIGICDDEYYIVKTLDKMIKTSLKDMNENVEVVTFTSPKELLKEAAELQAIFLDVEMPEADGFEIGRRIYEKNPDCKLIMATGRVERFKEAFKIHAYRFITKPFEQDEVDDVIEAVTEVLLRVDSLELYLHRLQYQVQQKDILYFRAFNSYVEAVTIGRCYRRDLSLRAIEELLDERLFFRINKQYMVNLSYVTGYGNHKVHIGGDTFNVARRKWKEFVQKFLEFSEKSRG